MPTYGIKPEVMLHLDPGHRLLWVVEAPTAEAVRDFAYASVSAPGTTSSPA